MTRAQMLDTLKSLVEGRLDADAWLAWWNENAKAVEKTVGAASASKLKPNYPDSSAGAAINSQNEAMAILKKAGLRVKRSNRYNLEFAEFMKRYIKEEEAREKEKGHLLKPRIDRLKPVSPKLHACLYRNNKKIETFEDGASEQEIAKVETALKLRLPKPVRQFFQITKHFEVEGLQLDLSSLFAHPGDKSAPDGKRYLCLGNYFWKADGDQILVDVSKPSEDPPILYYAHEEPPPKIQPLARNWADFLEKLPKQFLNEMFYYS